MNPIIVIPARKGSTRFPNKPMALIEGIPMIVHVWKNCKRSKIGRVIVATDSEEIKDTIETLGGEVVMTASELASGTDRVLAAVTTLDPMKKFTEVVNVQGDLPFIDPEIIDWTLTGLERSEISTPVTLILDNSEIDNISVVKAIAPDFRNNRYATAEDFRRMVHKDNNEPFYHHIGVYAYTREALETFVGHVQVSREIDENLEQLRALENGMKITLVNVDGPAPGSVDTPEDILKLI